MMKTVVVLTLLGLTPLAAESRSLQDRPTRALGDDSDGVWDSVTDRAANAAAGIGSTLTNGWWEGPQDYLGQQLWPLVGSALGISQEFFLKIFKVASNLVYAVAMLAGFMYLPTNLMLVIGLLTFFFGPGLFELLLGLISLVLYTAAVSPVLFVFFVWVIVFLRSKLAQTVGHMLGLDIDQVLILHQCCISAASVLV